MPSPQTVANGAKIDPTEAIKLLELAQGELEYKNVNQAVKNVQAALASLYPK